MPKDKKVMNFVRRQGPGTAVDKDRAQPAHKTEPGHMPPPPKKQVKPDLKA
jgi:hypothetical protein